MESLFVFLVSFIIVFIISLIIYFIKMIRGKLSMMKEMEFINIKYHLDKSKLNYKKLGILFTLVNSLIISITGTLCTMIKFGYIWQLVIGFALLMAMIYSTYSIIGSILKKKEAKKKGKTK